MRYPRRLRRLAARSKTANMPRLVVRSVFVVLMVSIFAWTMTQADAGPRADGSGHHRLR